MKTFISFILCIAALLPVFSQDTSRNGTRHPDGSRIEALKVAYLTKKLSLSPEEAQRFWPVYNQYTAAIRKQWIEQHRNNIAELEREEKLLQTRKKYSAEFRKSLGEEKTNRFFQAEKEFRTYLRKELSERRKLRSSQPAGPRGQR